MELKLFLEQTGQSWVLQPNREYVIGCGQSCDILIPSHQMAEYHAKLSFNQITNTWYIYDLSNRSGVQINNQSVLEAPLSNQTRLQLSGGFSFIATPETNLSPSLPNSGLPATKVEVDTALPVTPPPPTYEPPTITPPPPPSPVQPAPQPQPVARSDNWQSNTPKPIPFPTTGGHITPSTSSLRTLTWSQYVREQMQASGEGLNRLATWFYLTTGFRNTPWIRAYGQTGFNAFDGYILPNFAGSAEAVAVQVEEQLSKLKQCDDTDCYNVRLTDAHIADSATQQFLGVELFPIQRDRRYRRADYRKFCVVDYHRVRTYLLVENYGSDLFVSWVTRFEPQPTSVTIGLWLLAAFVLTLFAFGTQNAFMIITPLLLWSEVYLITPAIMQSAEIVPKKANARLIVFLLTIPTVLVMLSLAGALFARNFMNNF